MRGITLDGTSSVEVSKNIVYGCFGMAYKIEGTKHIIKENLASDIKRLWPALSGTDDHINYGFHGHHQPNTYIGNVAVACYGKGFFIKNNVYTPPSILVRCKCGFPV